jgi:hypothetical protein
VNEDELNEQTAATANGAHADAQEHAQVLAATAATAATAAIAATAAAAILSAQAQDAGAYEPTEPTPKRKRKAHGELTVTEQRAKQKSEDLQRELFFKLTKPWEVCCFWSLWDKAILDAKNIRDETVVLTNPAGDTILLCYSYKHKGDITDESTPYTNLTRNRNCWPKCTGCLAATNVAPVANATSRFV